MTTPPEHAEGHEPDTRPVKPIPGPRAHRTVEMPAEGQLPPPPLPKRPDHDDGGGPDERQPWPITQLRTRMRSLTRVGRGGKAGFAAAEVESLFDDMAFTISEWMRLQQVEEEANRRLRAEHRKLHSAYYQMREHLQQVNGAEPRRTPVGAVAAVAGGQSQGERIVADAKAYAARIVANAEEEAARRRALAHLETPQVEPRPAFDDAIGFSDYLLAYARWLPRAVTQAQARAQALRAALPEAEQRVIDLRDEQSGLANVLPIAGAVLTGDVRDVAEIGAAAHPPAIEPADAPA